MPRWTPEARAKQAAKIKEWQPWKKSTGAKTIQGQANSAGNWIYRGSHKGKKPTSELLKEMKLQIKMQC